MSWHPKVDVKGEDAVRTAETWRLGISLPSWAEHLELAWDVQLWRIGILYHHAFTMDDF